MKRYLVIVIILCASIYSLIVFNTYSDKTVYFKTQDNIENVNNEENNNNKNVNEEMAVEKLFTYLWEQDQASKGFEIHLEEKEQEDDKYIMQVYQSVGEDDSQSNEQIGLYSVNKNTGEIKLIN
ncbi:hypothetical protein [Guptibacillus hwajinpoensis]|uniref:hypothetical protein n=1 Tax=Guptibacillus hwajinpoensis TaxID=208199 RepID=UPI003734DEE5